MKNWYKHKWLISLVLILGIGLMAIFSVGGYVVGKYNGLITANQNVTTSWAQVETQYQRRFDLIPNLVEATKGFLRQEQTVFKTIAQARTHYAGTLPTSPERVRATGEMETALARLLVVIENYPQLKSSETVQSLMDELAGTENRIAVARFRYNETAQFYNTTVQRFPGNLIANVFGFKERPFFESQEPARMAPKINLEIKS